MSNSIFDFKSIRNHPHRNGFDLSNKNSFTAKCGELLPIYHKYLIPGDKVDLKVQHFTRTVPVSTAAYTRLRENFEWFFVPMRLLWKDFNSVITQMQEYNMTSANGPTSNYVPSTDLPYLTLGNLVTLSSTKKNISLLNALGTTVDEVGLSSAHQTAKLLSYLGYCYVPDSFVNQDVSGKSSVVPFIEDFKVSPFPLFAYQKIYQDYYRNSRWEKACPQNYNCDYVVTNDTAEYNLYDFSNNFSFTPEWLVNNFATMRYCNWQKDLYQSFFPSAQFGDTASISFSSSPQTVISQVNIPQKNVQVDGQNIASRYRDDSDTGLGIKITDLSLLNGSTLSSDGPLTVPSGMASVTNKISSITAKFDILQLRTAQALQKWREVSQADTDFKSQIKNHFGVDVPNILSGLSIRIGGTSSYIDINEVVNTNLFGSDSEQGTSEIAGKGTGVDDSSCGNFTSTEYGILMCIYHVSPIIDYQHLGTDFQLLKTSAEDYPIPEFDHIGLQELPLVGLSNYGYGIEGATLKPSSTIGYTTRYFDCKTSLDQVNGAFLSSLPHWVSPITNEMIQSLYANMSVANYRNFKVRPQILDSIFSVNVSDGVDYDQFLVNSYMDVKIVRNLDYDGMPY